MAPAICYESLLTEHAEIACKSGAEVYLASVAKSIHGVEKALKYFPSVARKYSMTILMSNCIGSCDDFESAGRSSVWNKDGLLVGQLNDIDEGILIFDTDTEEIFAAIR
jgi:predicted amidohydrolase